MSLVSESIHTREVGHRTTGIGLLAQFTGASLSLSGGTGVTPYGMTLGQPRYSNLTGSGTPVVNVDIVDGESLVVSIKRLDTAKQSRIELLTSAGTVIIGNASKWYLMEGLQGYGLGPDARLSAYDQCMYRLKYDTGTSTWKPVTRTDAVINDAEWLANPANWDWVVVGASIQTNFIGSIGATSRVVTNLSLIRARVQLGGRSSADLGGGVIKTAVRPLSTAPPAPAAITVTHPWPALLTGPGE